MLAAVVSSVGFALSRGSLLTPTRSSRAFSASRVRLALDGEVEKSLYALGQKIGVQLGDLKCFSPKEIDSVFAGMKDNIVGAPSQVHPPPQPQFPSSSPAVRHPGWSGGWEAPTHGKLPPMSTDACPMVARAG